MAGKNAGPSGGKGLAQHLEQDRSLQADRLRAELRTGNPVFRTDRYNPRPDGFRGSYGEHVNAQVDVLPNELPPNAYPPHGSVAPGTIPHGGMSQSTPLPGQASSFSNWAGDYRQMNDGVSRMNLNITGPPLVSHPLQAPNQFNVPGPLRAATQFNVARGPAPAIKPYVPIDHSDTYTSFEEDNPTFPRGLMRRLREEYDAKTHARAVARDMRSAGQLGQTYAPAPAHQYNPNLAYQYNPNLAYQFSGAQPQHTEAEIRAVVEAEFDAEMEEWLSTQYDPFRPERGAQLQEPSLSNSTRPPDVLVSSPADLGQSSAPPDTNGPLTNSELARAAEQLVSAVQDDSSEKFRNSKFLDLMRKIASQEVIVQGNNLVETSQTTTTPDLGNPPDVTGSHASPSPEVRTSTVASFHN
ncbi:hypothetical protein BJ170DRAFT_166682 [Xylariales sp. AK1849]|nr:hypothetical protein BJ170DRAFT_166682 [Xylariales sp. AK1849]